MNIVKFKRDDNIPLFGIVDENGIHPVTNADSISRLFKRIKDDSLVYGESLPYESVHILPPSDENVSVYCAGLNYSDHAEELKMPLPGSPIFFFKGYGAVTGPVSDVIFPDKVSLLDYEIELAAVIGRRIEKDDTVSGENIHNYLLGITILNDISARDMQLKTGQWFLGKCYRTFAPLGPIISTMTDETVDKLYELELHLQVYSEGGEPCSGKMQRGNTKNMIFKIHDLINCLTERFPLNPGDIIATGTPCGVAMSKPGHFKSRLAEILGIPQGKRTAAFIESEKQNNKNYLIRGDLVTARIYSEDGSIDLGEQRNRIV